VHGQLQPGQHIVEADPRGATLARDAGARLDIQDQLNHADPRTTRRYDHGGARLDRAPANMLVGYIETGDSAE
jgi:integrase